jgi:ABC-type multidrug transport system fused ATPase/permease subunit
MSGRTTFMIAHRLATLANCDARLEVEDGRVVRFEQKRTAISGVGKNVAESSHTSREVRE